MFKRAVWNGIVVCALVLVAGLPVAAQDGETVPLTLNECLKMALENNLDLVSARMTPEINEQQVVRSDSGFDPTLVAGVTHSESEQEVFNLSDFSSNTFDGGSVTFQQLLRYGGDVNLVVRGGRSETSGALVTLDTNYSAALDVTYNMPLLQGFGKETNTEQLLISRGNLDISRRDLTRQIHLTMETVEGAYWNVAAGRQALDVARSSLQRAQDQLDLNRKKVEVGTLPPIDITQAEAEVASREEGVIVAETDLLNAEDELRRLLAVPESDPMWERSLIPVDRPSFDESSLDLAEVLAVALDNRPEMESSRLNLELLELSERVARRNVRPALDLQARVTPAGNNFTPDAGPDMIFGTIDDQPVSNGKLIEALGEVPDFESYDWSIGLQFTYPIGNRQRKADRAVASINKSRGQVELANQEQTIRVEVRRAVRGVESGIKRVRAAQASVELERKKLDAEQKKFENGMSTSFEVFTFQTDLANAELSLIRAAVEYTKALTALEVAKGTLLEARGLSLAAE